jgi:hypothetical protein
MQSMGEEIEIAGIRVPKADWDATPASIKAVVVVLSERLSAIEEQLKQNSQNSSHPPSSDGFNKPKATKSQKEGEENFISLMFANFILLSTNTFQYP